MINAKIFYFEKYFRKFVPIYILARYIFIKFFSGSYYEIEAEGFKQFKKKKNLTIVDIGANDGLSTNFFLKNFYNSKIVVFEPIKNIIKFNFKKNNQNKVKIINCALGQRQTNSFLFIPYTFFFSFKLYLSAYSKVFYKKSHFIPNENLKSFYVKNFFYKILNVKVLRLDHFNVNPDIIKLDVEGFEHDVLKGAIKTIKKNRPVLYIENPSKQIKKFLLKMNYSQYYFNHSFKKFSAYNKTKNIDSRNSYFFYKKNINYFL